MNQSQHQLYQCLFGSQNQQLAANLQNATFQNQYRDNRKKVLVPIVGHWLTIAFWTLLSWFGYRRYRVESEQEYQTRMANAPRSRWSFIGQNAKDDTVLDNQRAANCCERLAKQKRKKCGPIQSRLIFL